MNRSAEGQGNSVDEAIQQALREVGLSADEVFVEILSEGGRRGLFGSGRRAHVRVTAKDAVTGKKTSGRSPQKPKEDGVAAKQKALDTEVEEPESTEEAPTGRPAGRDGNGFESAEGAREELTPEEWLDLLDQEAEMAADFVEGLLDRLDLPGDLEIEVTEDQALVNVQDLGSGLLIGRRGATLDALQELVRSAVQRQTQRRSHVRVDVEGYRARQLEKLRDKCREAIAEVRETSKPVRLEPMDAYERKMMHDLVAKTRGVTSTSEGSEPKRRVVIEPA